MSLRFVSYARSDAGAHRQHNEDAFIERGRCGLWAVADGMGGHRRGDAASRMLVEALGALPEHGAAPLSGTLAGELADRVDAVDDAVERVNHELRLLAASESAGTIGTTTCILLLSQTHAVCCWAGDSRIYLLRDRHLQQLTHDHALVTEMVDHGVLSAEEASSHPYGNLVTRAVGTSELMVLDMEILEVRHADRFLLCTDGLTHELEAGEIENALVEHEGRAACDWLIEQALARGCKDNVTVLVVDVSDAAGMDQQSAGAATGEDTMDEELPLVDPQDATSCDGAGRHARDVSRLDGDRLSGRFELGQLAANPAVARP
ncbi:MAG: serine/threonine-protein phosphatase [Gammaproteobacteria bacterium]|nr:serine/threonine-protein phosphatase [Gammaproteobacteria bacterium]